MAFDCRLINDEDQRLIGPVPLDLINKLLERPAIEWLVVIRRDFRQPMPVGIGDFDFSRLNHAATTPQPPLGCIGQGSSPRSIAVAICRPGDASVLDAPPRLRRSRFVARKARDAEIAIAQRGLSSS